MHMYWLHSGNLDMADIDEHAEVSARPIAYDGEVVHPADHPHCRYVVG